MDDISTLDQIYDWVLKAYKKAQENGLTLTGFAVSRIVCLAIWAILWLFKNRFVSYLKNMLSWPKKSDSSTSLLPKNQQNTSKDIQGMQKLLKEVCEAAPPKDAEIYKKILEKIKHLNEKELLKDSINDLLQNLDFEDQTTIDNFLKLRVALRQKVFETKAIDIDTININTLDWDGVCHLLEKYVKPIGRDQRLTWYRYIENNGINGSLLLEDSKIIAKNLGLNPGQKKYFDDLIKKIRGDGGEGPSTTNIDNSTIGAMVKGGNTTFHKPIKVTGSKTVYAPKERKVKKVPKQKTDHVDNDQEDDDAESNLSD